MSHEDTCIVFFCCCFFCFKDDAAWEAPSEQELKLTAETRKQTVFLHLFVINPVNLNGKFSAVTILCGYD